ncbi:ubiquitin-conjugating enzyme [Fusarium beomiforme]|uniref:Ubiquitin-conjugating enzyme n=1 Tax=Fusarium beomiforme TaxID=44412 RepID=A0A9P5E4N6_9HYPO|nr:ubiquitin-conjugating enzyme [Fusarium beomiforme]
MFHPLITPLTTYMYTTDIQESGTVSASDQERLPPGGFSLRHGFPDWFGRGRRSLVEAKQVPVTSPGSGTASTSTTSAAPASGMPSYMRTGQKSVSAYEVLHYIRSAFDTEEVLDSVPLAAAGNPGAWHAWRTHRKATGKLVEDEQADEDSKTDEKIESGAASVKSASSTATPRRPGEWNWDGVWEDRVKKNVSASLSEPVLYGETKNSDDLIKFLAMEDTDIDSVKENLSRTLGQAT